MLARHLMLRCSNLGWDKVSLIYQIYHQMPHRSKDICWFENRFTCHSQHLIEAYIKFN